MKRILSIAIAVLITTAMLTGCSKTTAPNDNENNSAVSTNGESNAAAPTDGNNADKISVVATIFPPYDFTRAIVGDKAEITMLLPPAAESHSYEPTPQDIIKIQNCDVFIYNGGDSDAWVDEVLESMDTSKMKIVKFIDCVEVVEEEIVEGMEDDEHDHEGGAEIDPADVKDRPMSDFAGAWESMVPLIIDGSLDEYIRKTAEAAGATFEDYKALAPQMVATDYENITISGGMLTAGGASANYAYKGYEIIESEHGSSVWYKYESDTPNNLPKYLMFNDHQIASGAEPEKIPHIHMKYGNDGFDALYESQVSPFYFAAGFTHEEIGEFMAGGHGHEDEEPEYDEHVWTSPRNAKLIVQKISDTLCAADPANAAAYKANTAAYCTKLDELDAKFKAVVDGGVRKTIVFGDRFPFRYFADAYGLKYFAAFPGCSTETEASAATVAFLIDKVKAEKIPVVFHIELSNAKMANTIAEETGAKVLELHACHNISKSDFEAGRTYIDIMTANVDALREALQ